MQDGMTEEQRARLNAFLHGEDHTTKPVEKQDQQPCEHLLKELRILAKVAQTEETLVGLYYYAQAVADLQYFLKHGVSLREAESADQRGREGARIMASCTMQG